MINGTDTALGRAAANPPKAMTSDVTMVSYHLCPALLIESLCKLQISLVLTATKVIAATF